jgi:chaperonin GroEL
MIKNIEFNPSSLQKLQQGVNILANTVKVTLGPLGRNVLIEGMYSSPTITKDGVTVAKSISLKDQTENMAAEVLQQAASKVVTEVGDGTTTGLVLAQALFNEGYKYIQSGLISPIEFKRQVEKAKDEVITTVKEMSTPISSKEHLQDIASISANNDTILGNLIADAFEQAGSEGIVLTQDSKSTDTFLEFTKGAKIDRGFISPHFITDKKKLTCEFENPLILFYDKKLRAAKDILPIVTIAAKANRPLLVVAEEIESQALSVLLVNKIQAQLQLCAIKAPAFGERRTALLQDLALLTGATLFTENLGKSLEQCSITDLGTADKITVTKNSTVFVVTPKDQSAINTRIEEVKAELESTPPDHSYDLQKLKERIAMLAGKVAIINVGAYTDIELKEKKFRLDDAIQATQAALKAGFVPGGGTVFAEISKTMLNDSPGFIALKNTLKAPLQTLCENGNHSFGVVYNAININKGFDSKTSEFVNLIERGVIDPTLVLITALDAAVSVATALLLTAACITIDAQDLKSNETYIPEDPNQTEF